MRDRKSDESLALLAQAGDSEATEELLNRYKNAVRSRARKFFLEGGETEDLVQEGMIGLYGAIGAFKPEAGKSFKNFAYLCVSRRIYDEIRKAGKYKESEMFDPDTLAEGVTPEDFLLDIESRAELRVKLMGALSDFEFRVMTLYLDGNSYAEIVNTTGKSMKSIDNALARSKKKLKQTFTERP